MHSSDVSMARAHRAAARTSPCQDGNALNSANTQQLPGRRRGSRVKYSVIHKSRRCFDYDDRINVRPGRRRGFVECTKHPAPAPRLPTLTIHAPAAAETASSQYTWNKYSSKGIASAQGCSAKAQLSLQFARQQRLSREQPSHAPNVTASQAIIMKRAIIKYRN